MAWCIPGARLLSLSAALRNTQGRGPFNSDATASCDTEICNCRGVEAFGSGRRATRSHRLRNAGQMARDASSLYARSEHNKQLQP